VVSGRSCLPFRNHTFLEGKLLLLLLANRAIPLFLPSGRVRCMMLENAMMRIDHLRACVKRGASG
jgi:hypothetical protein